MPTFALLGATGTIGGHVLRELMEETNHNVRAFVRSKDKLLKQLPDKEVYSTALSSPPSSSRLQIYEGDLTSLSTLESCIDRTDAVFLCTATTVTKPGTRVARDQAEAVVSALQSIRNKDPAARVPRLVVLSSAETEFRLCEDIPPFMRTVLFNANYYIYIDLIEAEKYLRKHSDWLSTVFVKPGGLSMDIRHGHQISETKQQTFLSFMDLAGGMVEIAETVVAGDKWDGKSLSVISPSSKAKVQWSSVPLLVKGLLIYYFPWTEKYLN